jgi:cytochrome c-type biogenesis protein CcmH
MMKFYPKAAGLRRLIIVLVLLAAGGFISVLPAASQDGSASEISDDAVNDVAKDLFCPVCESTPLDVCPTQACADWRELIRTQLSEGKTKEDIFDYFARQYGDGVLARPPRRGFNLIVWVFPAAAVVVGGLFFGFYLRNLRKEGDGDPGVKTAVSFPAAPAKPASMDDYIAQIESELNES